MHTKANFISEHPNLEQMQAYLAGGLSPAEQHKLESHLLECQLCTDAIEGLELLTPQQTQESIDILKETIYKRTHPTPKRNFLTVSVSAAAVLMVVGVSYRLFVIQADKATAEQTAYQQKEIKEYQPNQEETTDNQTIIPKNTSEKLSNISEKKEQQTLKKAPQTVEYADEVVGLAAPPQAAQIEDDYHTKASESVVYEAEKNEAFAEKETALQDVKTVEHHHKRMHELKTTAAPSSGISRQRITQNPHYQEATPTEDFVKYMRDSLPKPIQDIKGSVRLSFTVNKKGKITDIQVIQSLCVPCDSQAVILLKSAPRWEAAQENGKKIAEKQEIEVNF